MKRANRLVARGKVCGFLALCATGAFLEGGCVRRGPVDYAESSQVQQWLHHPVYGDPSFDAFERTPGNPIHRGAPPFEWPVNGFYFVDPVGGNWYIYVGDYCRGYAGTSSRCLLYRSRDQGETWENLGPVLEGDGALFDKSGHTPDVSVVFEDGRYHMIYDWVEPNFHEGGLAYAWADKPEGPFHRAPEPITRRSVQTPLLGQYQRTYAATLIRRKADWLVTAMMDIPPSRWALVTMTAPRPEGPYSERQMVRQIDEDYYHPPLLEFYPSFSQQGYLYAPATSVALNRNFNAIFRAPLERATEAGAWEIYQHGSAWHAEDVENEAFGLWGQTFSGAVDAKGTFQVMFNSRDPRGLGTVNLARRPWKQPLRERGFVMTGHAGPSLTCLRKEFAEFALDATVRVRGTARIFWDYHGALGPDRPQSDATLHALTRSGYRAVELSPASWRMLDVDAAGKETVLASGTVAERPDWHFTLERLKNGRMQLASEGQTLWSETASGPTPRAAGQNHSGPLGLLVAPHSFLAVDQFSIRGTAAPAHLTYLPSEALLGAGESLSRWDERRGAAFSRGLGLVARQEGAHVKWNVVGRQLSLWSPRGPEFGRAELVVDGRSAGEINLNASTPMASQVVWQSAVLPEGLHALVLRARTGHLPVDCLEVAN